jgi:hypothetical protein
MGYTMSIRFVQGDIFMTQAHTVAVGMSASGRFSVTPFHTALHDRYPVFISECSKRGHGSNLTPGAVWVWREAQPWLVGLVIQETPPGAVRLRYVETAMLNLYKDWEREGLHSLAIMRFGDDGEWPTVRAVLEDYLSRIALPVIVYEAYRPGVDGEGAESR